MALPNPIPQGGRPMGITTWTLRVHYQKCGQTTAMKKYDRYMRTFLCARSNLVQIPRAGVVLARSSHALLGSLGMQYTPKRAVGLLKFRLAVLVQKG